MALRQENTTYATVMSSRITKASFFYLLPKVRKPESRQFDRPRMDDTTIGRQPEICTDAHPAVC